MALLNPRDAATLTFVFGQLHAYLRAYPSLQSPPWSSLSYFKSKWMQDFANAEPIETFLEMYRSFPNPGSAISVTFAFLYQGFKENQASAVLSRTLWKMYERHSSLLNVLVREYQSLWTELPTNTQEDSCFLPLFSYQDLPDDESLSETFLDCDSTIGTSKPESEDSVYSNEESGTGSILANGRPRLRAAKKPIFYEFTRVSRSKAITHLKKEYFRCQHIRALKKSIRQIEGGKSPFKSIHRLDVYNSDQMKIWLKLTHFYRQNSVFLQTLSRTYNGPATDGRGKCYKTEHLTETSEAKAKSFNNAYCKGFFSNQVTQKYNLIYCDLIYDNSTPEILCQKMKIYCCRDGCHSHICVLKWEVIKHFAQVAMLKELGISVNSEDIENEELEYFVEEA